MVVRPFEGLEEHETRTNDASAHTTSALRRWIHSVIAVALLALPIASASGQEKKTELTKSEEVKRLTEEQVKELVKDFPHPSFKIRETAIQMIGKDLDAWYKDWSEAKGPYPHLSLLKNAEWSLEASKRGERLMERCDRHEMDHLWNVPTEIAIPEAWRTEGPTVHQALRQMECQCGRRFDSIPKTWPKEKRLAPITSATLPYWELLNLVEAAYGCNFYLSDQTSDGSVMLSPFNSSMTRPHSGSIAPCAVISSTHVEFNCIGEPKIGLIQTILKEAFLTLPDGTRVALEWRRMTGDHYTVLLPQLEKARVATLTMDVILRGYRIRTFTLTKPKESQTFTTRSCACTIDGTQGKLTQYPSLYWGYTVPFHMKKLRRDDPEDVADYRRRLTATAARSDDDSIHFHEETTDDITSSGKAIFWGSPQGATIRVPDLATSAVRTFHLRDIPIAAKK